MGLKIDGRKGQKGNDGDMEEDDGDDRLWVINLGPSVVDTNQVTVIGSESGGKKKTEKINRKILSQSQR